MNDENAIALEAKGITKHFGGIHALEQVDFELRQSEVMGLVGDNGAGKSTLMNILTGVYPPNEGKIFLCGQEIQFRNRQHARSLGIEGVYQDLALVDSLDAAPNVFLGSELIKRILGFPFLANARMRGKAVEVLESKVGIQLSNSRAPVFNLSGGQKQSVAIARAIYKSDTQVLVMDEPTAALGPEETEKILDLVRSLSAQGLSIIIIAHNLEHVFSVSNRVTVLRRGRIVGVREMAKSSKKEILGLIIGVEEKGTDAAVL